MIGYEFELLVREGDRPLSKTTFEKFHAELARRGWKNKYDAGTLGLTGSQKDDWIVTTDDGICIMEINTPPRDTIGQCDQQICTLLHELQTIWKALGASIIGVGAFPGPFDTHKTKCADICREEQCCNKSYIKYFNAQRFPKGHHALMIFAGHHVWLDVPHQNLMSQWSAFERLTPIINVLFANGPIVNNYKVDILDARDMLWKTMMSESIHGDETAYYGMPPQEFKTLSDYFKFQLSFPFYFDLRDDKGYKLKNPKITYGEFFHTPQSEAVFFDGTPFTVTPQLSDFWGLQQRTFSNARIKYRIKADVTLNTIINAIDHNEEDTFLNCFSKVFIEYRNIGAQPQPDISAGPAFLLGMQEKILEAMQLLDQKPYTFWKQFCDLTLKDGFNAMSEGIHAVELCNKLLNLSQAGLQERGFGEEKYLAPLWQRLERKENPAQELIKLWDSGGLPDIWQARDFK